MAEESTEKEKKKPVSTSGLNLKREQADAIAKAKAEAEAAAKDGNRSVSAGPLDKVIDFTFNPSRDKIREVTIIDRMQGRLFPIMDTTNALFANCIEIAAYRLSPDLYAEAFNKPQPDPVLDIMGELMYRTAQWQKSVAGKNLERATDIALAEIEAKGEEEDNEYDRSRGYDE